MRVAYDKTVWAIPATEKCVHVSEGKVQQEDEVRSSTTASMSWAKTMSLDRDQWGPGTYDGVYAYSREAEFSPSFGHCG